MHKYPVLQSGFINSSDNGLTTPVEYNDLVISNVLSKDYRTPSNKYFFSPKVVELYTHWCEDPTVLKDFEFRERIISLAKSSFGEPSIFKWFNLQKQYANLSNLHIMFIYDTFNYLLGQPRKIQSIQWITLLEASIKTQTVSVDINKYFDKTFIKSSSGYLPSKLTDFISLWLNKPNGFEDLLITLFIIFGNRPYISDVSENPTNIVPSIKAIASVSQ